MHLTRMHAGGKGVQAADAVGKPLFLKEFKGAVGNRGLVAEALGGQTLQHVIGPHGTMRLGQYLQHAATYGGKAQTPFGGQRLGLCKQVSGAMRMIMLVEGGGMIRWHEWTLDE